MTLESFQGEFNHTTNIQIQPQNIINVLTESRFIVLKFSIMFLASLDLTLSM